MTIDDYNAYCESLLATTHVVQWGGSHVWKVGGKVFAIGSPQNSSPAEKKLQDGGLVDKFLAVSFKVSDYNFELLKEEPGYRPAPYLASRGMKWIQQTDTVSPEKSDQLKYYISESHRIVSLGLTKKLQKSLGLNQE